MGVAVGGESVDPGATGIAETEQLGDLVVGLAGGVVHGAAYVAVVPGVVGGAAAREIEMGMTTGDDQRQQREWDGSVPAMLCLHEDGVNVALKMVDGDEGLAGSEGQRLGIKDADQERSGETGALRDGDGVKVFEADAGLGHGGADDRDDVAQMLAAGELGDDAAIVGVQGDLAGDDVGQGLRTGANDGGGGLVAGGFDAEDQAGRVGGRVPHVAHLYDSREDGMTWMTMERSAGFQRAAWVAQALVEAGFAAHFAGGCVRDLLLGRTPDDYDVATSATPDEVMALFTGLGRKTLTVGAHFGVVLVCGEGHGQDHAVEVATFRHDGAYSDGRRPDAVRFSTEAREDVVRRDFTINGMLLDVALFEANGDLQASVLDFVGGREDLKAGVVRAIGDPELRFTEDKLRMLRGVRFAARLGFSIEAGTFRAMKAHAGEIGVVSLERIRDELTRMLTEGSAHAAFEMLDATGLLAEVLPEVTKMHGVEQPPEYHPEGDVFVHTMMLLENLRAGCSATLGWGALLHDVGKPATFQPPQGPGDRIRFNGHVEVGVRIAEVILGRLRFSGEETEQILALVRNHMKFGDVTKMKRSTLMRFLRMPQFEEHLALHWMDCMAAHGRMEMYWFAKREYESVPVEEMRPALLVTGKDLIAAGYRPGPRFKEMLEMAEDAQLEGRIGSREQGLEMVRERFGTG